MATSERVSKYHTHSIPLDMEDIRRDWDKPLSQACLAAKTSVIVRVGALDLGSGTGSFRVREMMHRIAYPLGVHVRADVNLTDIEATCTDGKSRITEVIDLPTTGVNTERIWLLEHYADWFSVNLGLDSMYHRVGAVSEGLVQNLEKSDVSAVSAQLSKQLKAERKAHKEQSEEASDDPVLDALEQAEVTIPVSMVRAQSDDIAGEGSTDDDLRSESMAALEASDDATKAAHAKLLAQRTAVAKTAAAAQPAPAAQPEPADQPASAAQSAAAKPQSAAAQPQPAPATKRQRKHRPITGEYAAHFDHVNNPGSLPRREITVGQAHERLDLIERRKPLYSPAFAGLASAIACASFVFLLGGGPYDMIGAFVGAGLGHWLRRRLFAHHLNQFFVTFVCVAVAALACTGTLRLIGLYDPIALQHDTAYIGAMLFVIPGFPLITGGLDMAKIDFPSGIQRVTYVLCIILMATLAGWMAAVIVHLNPTGFEPQGLDAGTTGVLRALFAFLGVWGFSVMFNSPQRMCLVAALIGTITDTLRLEIVDLGVPAEAGAFIGAFLAGLLAAAWRSAVRGGLLPPHLGYPRICLTVPSIVIMVPGMYMYRAMFYLGQFDTQQALDWAFRAFMVIICLPIGLAMARVLTDKSWRYDI
ncbi:threonine/serine exporter family protein [Bifidobacterium jacchi]|uniref:Threonine/serine exporter family protein n=2 Tax=Bifidobacterium jacchi TaxID=2490545 RepID=A0A5N5RMR9_9BIFI|nr:threonine/serine exporter family protein [Bifidobacterium jacchi]KAB5608588.1 threonine/serine exporter family protein [Bifidobacterium jacchi]